MIAPDSTSYPFLALAQTSGMTYREVLAISDYYKPPGRFRDEDVHWRNYEIAKAALDRLFGPGVSDERRAFVSNIHFLNGPH